MTTYNDSNNTDAIIIATARFYYSDTATTAAMAGGIGYGYIDIGNINKASIKSEVKRKDVYGSYRGIRRKDKTFVTDSSLSFEIESHELNKTNLGNLFCASAGTAHTQSSKTTQNADELTFAGGTPSVAGRWYDIRFSNARYRALTTVTIATLTEGTDFEVDLLLGRIRFITTQTAARVPVVTCPAITSSDQTYFHGQVPLGTLIKQGFGRIVFFDQDDANKVVADYLDFECQLTADGALDFDGENESKLKLTVSVMGDNVGVLMTRLNLA